MYRPEILRSLLVLLLICLGIFGKLKHQALTVAKVMPNVAIMNTNRTVINISHSPSSHDIEKHAQHNNYEFTAGASFFGAISTPSFHFMFMPCSL